MGIPISLDHLENALDAAARRGAISNREFALFRNGRDDWYAEAGNPCRSVNLGESSGEAYGGGKNPQEAIQALVRRLDEMVGDCDNSLVQVTHDPLAPEGR